ncbi:dethiobiotin synthase [Desulforamulus putei]|uniref:dethiobiotin synthase n=1 Tax=Desulforamulus putei TaxID=74701 RepID=UPI002FDCC8D4
MFVLGTDTDVGKTVISAGIMYRLLLKGYKACYFKPVSSGGADIGRDFYSYDVSFVKNVSGFHEVEDKINPFRFKTPVSPHLASSLENRKININVILDTYKELKKKYDFILVEGCGGLAVPLTDEGYMQYQLIKDLGLGCVLVSKTTLGTINHTLLTLKFAENIGIKIEGILFNGYNGSRMEDDNIKTIGKLADIPVLGVIPRIVGINVENLQTGNLKAVFEESTCIEDLIAGTRIESKCTILRKLWNR